LFINLGQTNEVLMLLVPTVFGETGRHGGISVGRGFPATPRNCWSGQEAAPSILKLAQQRTPLLAMFLAL
jgi:hypothetical protein